MDLDSYKGLRCVKSRLVLLLVLIVVESAVCRNAPHFESRTVTPDADKLVFTPFFDVEGNPSHGPSVVTLQVSDGTGVDCVPVEQQISAHLPSLKGRPVQTKATLPQEPDFEVAACQQLFQLEHGSCPEGTIGIARHRKKGNGTEWRSARRRMAESMWTFSSGTSKYFEPTSNGTVSAQLAPAAVWDLGYASTDLSWSGFNLNGVHDFIGFGATLSLQQPYFEAGYQSASGARISYNIAYWSNPYGPAPQWAGGGEISAGFLANPTYFGDNLPRFYTYWGINVFYTKEGTGNCYNMDCPGYTHVSPNIVLGAPVTGTEMSLFILMDLNLNRYNLFYGTELVGFWNHAETIGWRLQHFVTEVGLGATAKIFSGGIVTPIVTNGRVTNTHMGTGKYSNELGAAYVRNVVWQNKNDNLWYQVPTTGLSGASTWATVPPQCYDAYIGNGDRVDWGTYLLYGGRGGENPTCLV
ncbi:hypothetical protein M758_12G124200 [Ceratodon purpureus]|nr:hypothetical protein M758_12G124200 [Ceratodon purpureus]